MKDCHFAYVASQLAFALIFGIYSMFYKRDDSRCEPIVAERALPSLQYRDVALCHMLIKLHERETHPFDLVSRHANITWTDDIRFDFRFF